MFPTPRQKAILVDIQEPDLPSQDNVMTNLLVEYARFYGSLKSLIDHVEHKLISNEDMIESVKMMMIKFERERNRFSKREQKGNEMK